ncbi:Lysophospholipid acyltransferase LPEAT-like [Carpediemonas membranifera]|uniref:Lysophospholipid acyltransferase LPEAT-like n=1 Tax=Carpediemonas membranifera TaxID=201153 RepID=A0A8J6BWW8_9EUKA|nr:Lysophospholipid acyltransferase LPEAT-like [Carpediemonas membranifera]|eukprot:KAG9392841.1 Lysophospholipid acyltransferase LPEAT-like [Carpediemonas membranifera]
MVVDILLRNVIRRRPGPSPKRAPSAEVRSLLFEPFLHHEGFFGAKFSLYEIAKMLLFSWWLPIVRVGTMWAVMIIYFFIAEVFFGALTSDKTLPPPDEWRMRLMRQQTRFGSRLCCFITGWHIKTIGEPAGRQDDGWEPPVISNHIAHADIVTLCAHNHTAFVAKSGLKKVPVMRSFANLWQVVMVKRKTADSRDATQKLLRDRCMNPNAPSPTLFPEGSTTNGKWLMPFRPGIFRLGMPVQPVLLHYPNKRCSTAWDTCTLSLTILRTESQFINWVELHYLPLYTPSEEEKADPYLYAENVRQAMISYAHEHKIDLQATEANIMEKLIYQDYCDGKISWGKALEDLQALFESRADQVTDERRELLAETIRRTYPNRVLGADVTEVMDPAAEAVDVDEAEGTVADQV